MDPAREYRLLMTRRQLLGRMATGIGTAALASLLNPRLFAATGDPGAGLLRSPHFAPRAKRVISMFMSGGPSHLDLFQPKPRLREMHDTDLPTRCGWASGSRG